MLEPIWKFYTLLICLNAIPIKQPEKLGCSMFNYEPKTKIYPELECHHQNLHFITDHNLQLTYGIGQRLVKFCLHTIQDYPSILLSKLFNYTIRWWTGKICETHVMESSDNTSHAFGYIEHDCFIGYIKININYSTYFSRVKKLNRYNHSIIKFTNHDYNLKLRPQKYIKQQKRNFRERNLVNSRHYQSELSHFTKTKYCYLSIYIHQNFLISYNSNRSALIAVFNSVFHLNDVMSRTALFDHTNILNYQISDIRILDDDIIRKLDADKNPEIHLKIFNEYLEDKKDTACQSILYTASNYFGVLGLAYIGTAAGTGICGQKSGILLTKTNVFHISDILMNNVLTHEIGHSLGCLHDPSASCDYESKSCPAGSVDHNCAGNIYHGRYLMHPHAKYFGGTYSNIFSRCSIRQMEEIFYENSRTKCLKDNPPKNFDFNSIYKKFRFSSKQHDMNFPDLHKYDSYTSLFTRTLKYVKDLRFQKSHSTKQISNINCDSIESKRCETLSDTSCLIRCWINQTCLPLTYMDKRTYYKPPGSLCNNGNGYCSIKKICRSKDVLMLFSGNKHANISLHEYIYHPTGVVYIIMLEMVFTAFAIFLKPITKKSIYVLKRYQNGKEYKRLI